MTWGYQQRSPAHRGEIYHRNGGSLYTAELDDKTVKELKECIEKYEDEWGNVE